MYLYNTKFHLYVSTPFVIFSRFKLSLLHTCFKVVMSLQKGPYDLSCELCFYECVSLRIGTSWDQNWMNNNMNCLYIEKTWYLKMVEHILEFSLDSYNVSEVCFIKIVNNFIGFCFIFLLESFITKNVKGKTSENASQMSRDKWFSSLYIIIFVVHYSSDWNELTEKYIIKKKYINDIEKHRAQK